ncbi:MAG TPA: hypothetical protein VIB47_10250, partial [Dehalococcoidia bacterium]
MSRQFSQRFEKYVRAARYGFDRDSLQAYTQAQDIIFKAECDLSAYRLRYQDVPHVVIVGLKPTLEL